MGRRTSVRSRSAEAFTSGERLVVAFFCPRVEIFVAVAMTPTGTDMPTFVNVEFFESLFAFILFNFLLFVEVKILFRLSFFALVNLFLVEKIHVQ
jgi:hypothetical protein